MCISMMNLNFVNVKEYFKSEKNDQKHEFQS